MDVIKASLETVKYINDPVYGGIPITQLELDLISLPIFQRLRGLRQLAKLNFVFPGAEHSRFVHSLGVLYIMELMTNHLLKDGEKFKKEGIFFSEDDAIKMRVAALLHDIGHYPLSHLGESAYGFINDDECYAKKVVPALTTEQNKLYALASSRSKSANHEELGEYIVNNNTDIKNVLSKYGLDAKEIGQIFTGKSFSMVYNQLLHSSLDADRLDYLLRDSFQTGVRYGLVDLHYLIRLLMIVKSDNKGLKKILVCNKKGQHVVEHFLMSRYFHYSQVIFHKTNVAFESLIKAMFIRLLQKKKFMYNSLDEIKENVNNKNFLNFNDANLEVSFKNFYESSDSDEEFKLLYKMYLERIRPKTVFELKDFYDENPQKEFMVLKWHLKRNPEKISKIIGSDHWGYQIIPITIEKIHASYSLSEASINKHEEDLQEVVRLYDSELKECSLLAEDKFSVIGRLTNFKSEFIRIFVFDTKQDKEYFSKIKSDIRLLIQS